MLPLRRLAHLGLGLAALGLLVGCNDGEDATGLGGGAGANTVTLSFAVRAPVGASPALLADVLSLTDGSNTLDISSAQLVLRDIKLKLVEDDCDETIEDDCDDFVTGPFLVNLLLEDMSLNTITLQEVAPGVYDEVRFIVHKLDDDDPDDTQFITQHSELLNISVKVTGTFNGNGNEFTYISDLNEKQRIFLSGTDLISVTGADPVARNVTIEIDLDSWFRTNSGTLVDPDKALKGEPFENLVRDNIKDSIEGFRDDDSDGIPHGDDDDED